MEGFLARHIEGTSSDPQVAEARRKELDDLLIGTDLARRVEGFRIWRSDGAVIYSTDKSLIGKTFPSSDIDLAFSGQVVAQLEDGHNDGEEGEATTGRPLIEIYAPIYRSGTRDIIAVGELYEDAAEFVVQRARVQRQTWAIVGATTLAIMIAVNTPKFTGAPIPFGGWKQSGLGREGSRHGLLEYLEAKYVCFGNLAACHRSFPSTKSKRSARWAPRSASSAYLRTMLRWKPSA